MEQSFLIAVFFVLILRIILSFGWLFVRHDIFLLLVVQNRKIMLARHLVRILFCEVATVPRKFRNKFQIFFPSLAKKNQVHSGNKFHIFGANFLATFYWWYNETLTAFFSRLIWISFVSVVGQKTCNLQLVHESHKLFPNCSGLTEKFGEYLQCFISCKDALFKEVTLCNEPIYVFFQFDLSI